MGTTPEDANGSPCTTFVRIISSNGYNLGNFGGCCCYVGNDPIISLQRQFRLMEQQPSGKHQ